MLSFSPTISLVVNLVGISFVLKFIFSSLSNKIDPILMARKNFAYGTQRDY